MELRLLELAVEAQGDVERERLFRRAVAADGAAILAAMAGIEHHRLEGVARVRGHARATADQGRSGGDAQKGDQIPAAHRL